MADDPPIIPTIGQVIGAGKQRLMQVRPSTANHVDTGRYGHVFEGWRAQFAILRRRLADEVKAARLPFAEGQALTDLARSEYETPRREGATAALGEVELVREVVHFWRTTATSAAAAVDADTLEDLLEDILDRLLEHLADRYDPATGTGAHVVADDEPLSLATDDMGDLVDTTNAYKLRLNRHFDNLDALGAGLPAHKDTDEGSAITAADAVASAPGSSFATNSSQARQGLLVLANACRTALDRHVGLHAAGGTLRAGTVFTVAPIPTAVPPVAGGQYAVVSDTYAPAGSQLLEAIAQATLAGQGPNLPIWGAGGPTLTITSSPLFDAAATLRFKPTTLRAAGGSSGQLDPELRRAAAAGWTGRFGPTDGAIIAGALQASGASQAVMLDDTARGESVLYAVDPTWCWSRAWAASIERVLRDDWAGVGCRIRSGRVVHRVIRVEAVVTLRSADLLVDTRPITSASQAALKAYFEREEGWYGWSEATLRAVLATAHRGILACPTARVLDQDGAVVDEPTSPAAGDDLTHWVFADKAFDASFTAPV